MNQLCRRMSLLSATALVAVGVGYGVPAALAVGNDVPEIRNPNPTVQIPSNSTAPKAKKQKQSDEKKAKDDKKSELDFIDGYKRARALIVDGQYAAGIAAMHALGHDEHPDVANYIGYANRKIGNYDQSKVWYEAALKADPDHTRTWSYYGMWHMEQGNRLKAEDFLAKVNALCGNTTCKEFIELRDVIDGTKSY